MNTGTLNLVPTKRSIVCTILMSTVAILYELSIIIIKFHNYGNQYSIGIKL